jgi:proline iminopeptidase
VPFPPIDPHTTGRLTTTDGAEIYWEECGSPDAPALVWLHGGPGSGLGRGGYRRQPDPARWRIIGLDQRGCGRSTPLVDAPGAALDALTTPRMIADLEELREHLGIASWLVAGGSWGTTLALAYAEAHPDRVTALVLAAVTTTSREEVEWISEAVGRIFPREWERFADASGRRPGERVVDAYDRLLRDPDAAVRAEAARAWCEWEDVHVSLTPGWAPNPDFEDAAFRARFATQVVNVWSRSAFLGDHGILDGLDRIAQLPAVLIHGRLDVSGPLATAWELHRRLPLSRLIVLEDEGHGGPSMGDELGRAYAAFAS